MAKFYKPDENGIQHWERINVANMVAECHLRAYKTKQQRKDLPDDVSAPQYDGLKALRNAAAMLKSPNNGQYKAQWAIQNIETERLK